MRSPSMSISSTRQAVPGIWLIALMIVTLLTTRPVVAQTVVTVQVVGVNKQLETNILLFLSIEQQKAHPLMSDGRIRRLHRKADAEIAAALQPYGYYRPQVSSSLEMLEGGPWRAVYTVDPGPAVRISEVRLDITGPLQQDPALRELLDESAPRPGDPLVHSAYDAFKSHLSGLTSERGYMEAKFTETRLEIDLKAYEARIAIGLESGPRYRFGEISTQQDMLDPELLQRFVPFTRGDPYELRQLIALQQALHDSNYFQVVEVSPGKPLKDSREVPVNVLLKPRKRHRYDFGLGFGTDTGARAKFGWRMPRVNQRGHRIDSEVVVSQIGYRVDANYRVPVLNPRTDQIIYTISRKREETETSDSLLSKVGVSLSHNRSEWREIVALNYQLEDFLVADEGGESTLLIPSISWSRTWGDEFINALDGVRFDIAFLGATEKVVSDTDFTQVISGIKFIYSINKSNRILMRGSFGATQTNEFEKLPTSIRFFAGGAQSVRGYAYQSLGPTNEDGEVIGGSNLLIGSIEYDHYFNDRWGVAAFFDVGNAIDSFEDDLEQGAGFGVRWRSPVGPVRIDLANAISTDDKNWRLHISIGPDL